MEWHQRGACTCGWTIRTISGSVFLTGVNICPECGAHRDSFSILTMRAENGSLLYRADVSDSVWYKPSTWGKSHVEERRFPEEWPRWSGGDSDD